MILHTIVPYEQIFHTNDDNPGNEMTVFVNNVQLVVRRQDDQWQLTRLISTNPNDYLDKRYQPGQYISFKQIVQ